MVYRDHLKLGDAIQQIVLRLLRDEAQLLVKLLQVGLRGPDAADHAA